MSTNENELPKKKVDESWKEEANKEKCSCGDEHAHGHNHESAFEVNFPLFISGLMMEGAIALGEAEHPVTKKKEPNLPHAKFIIETLAMLKEKTKNNLDKDEQDILESVLYNLRMIFVTKTEEESKRKK